MAGVRRILCPLVLLLLLLPAIAPPRASSAESISRFATGSTELQLSFGMGGETRSASIQLPGNAYVKSAAMTVSGREEDTNHSISQDAPAALAGARETENLTIGKGRLAMTTGEGAWVKDSDGEFEGDALENLTIDGGVALDRDWNATPNVMSDFVVSMGPESQWYPAMAADSNNTLIVTWVDGRKGSFDYDLYAKRYGPDGSMAGAEIEVSTAGGAKWYPSIATDSKNGFVVAWHQLGGYGRDIWARRFGPSGQPLGSDFIVCAQSGDQMFPSVAVNSRDEFMVVWEDYRTGTSLEIWARLFCSNGTPAGNELPISTGASWAQGPNVAALPGGDFEIAWSDNSTGEYDIYAAVYDVDAGALGSRFDVCTAAGNQTQPAIAAGKGISYDSVIAWRDVRDARSNIYARTFDASGSPSSSEIAANPAQIYQGEPSITVDPWENFIVSWDTYEIYYQTIRARGFSPGGSPLGAELLVCNISGVQSDPSIAAASDGRFMAAWNDGRSFSGSSDVYGRLYGHFGPYFRSGAITSRPSPALSQRPCWISLNFSAEGSLATSAQGWMRASDDGSAWTVWEMVPAGGTAGCRGRLLQWRICLATSRPASDTPRILNVTVSYRYFVPRACILSAPMPVGFNISEATVDLDATLAQGIHISLSVDNGSGWLDAPDGGPAKFPLPGKWLSYRLVFISEGNESPAVLGIFISLVICSYPVDVTVDVGADGTSEMFRNGPFIGRARLDFADGLVRSLAARQPAGTANIVIPVSIGSASLGRVLLSELAIDYSMNQKPSIELQQPPDGGTVHEDHTALVWSGHDQEGSQLSYELYLDNNDGSTNLAANLTSTAYPLAGLAEGKYFWKVRAFDGLEWNSTGVHSFIVRIDAAGPKIATTPPLRAVAGIDYFYDVNATDADGDRLEYSLAAAPAGMSIDPRNGQVRWKPSAAQAGSQEVAVNVSDGFFNVTQQFIVDVLAEIPRPSCSIQYPSVGGNVSGKITVRGTAARTESPIAIVEISVDDKGWLEAAGTQSWQRQIDTKGLRNGPHTLQARAYDGQLYSNVTQVSFNVDNRAGAGGGRFVPGLASSMVAAAWAGAMAAALLVKRK